MIAKRSLFPGPDRLAEGLGLKSLFAFFSSKAIRGGPRLLTQIVVCIVLLLTLTRLLPSRLSDITFGSSYTKILKWRPSASHKGDGSVGGGIRVVVFGGADIATPSEQTEAAWTEIMCQEMKHCNTHVSYVPASGGAGGALVSNVLYEAVLNRITAMNTTDSPGYDYSWLAKEYPVPSELPDLKTQMDAFLASPVPETPPRETIWVINTGFWDMWALAAIPRQLAFDVIQVQTTHMFEQIEALYQQAREEHSVAYSQFYPELENNTAPGNVNKYESIVLDVPAEPFRVFIASPYDISLTPGFETARFKPPSPHSPAEEMRNAAWLNNQWDVSMTQAIDAWLKTPDPLVNGTTNVTQLVERHDAAGNTVLVPNARREVITYDPSKYIKDIVVDRQLKNMELADHNGAGGWDMDRAYLNVQMPCKQQNATEQGVCEQPNDHLYWTDFTIGQRPIREIGKVAAERLSIHKELGTNWLKKWQTSADKNQKSFMG